MKPGTTWAKCSGWPLQILGAIRAVATVWEGSFKKRINCSQYNRPYRIRHQNSIMAHRFTSLFQKYFSLIIGAGSCIAIWISLYRTPICLKFIYQVTAKSSNKISRNWMTWQWPDDVIRPRWPLTIIVSGRRWTMPEMWVCTFLAQNVQPVRERLWIDSNSKNGNKTSLGRSVWKWISGDLYNHSRVMTAAGRN